MLNLLFSLVSQVCDYFIIGVFLFEASGGKIKKILLLSTNSIPLHKALPTGKLSGFGFKGKGKLTITNIFSVFQAWKVYQLGKHPIPEMKHTVTKQEQFSEIFVTFVF